MFVLFSQVLLTASNWVGGVGNWSVAANWNPVGVPTASDKVTIYSGEVTVDVDAFALNVVLGNAKLSIDSGVELLIEGSPDYGFRVNGASAEFLNDGTLTVNNSTRNGILFQAANTVTNNGVINVDGTTGFYHGIDCRVDLTNSATGEIYVDNTVNGSGILNYAGTQTFWNDGIIGIGLNDNIGYYGIDNNAEFYNNGDITIGSTSGTIGRGGIFNQAGAVQFYNDNALITIHNTGTNFPGIDNRKIFENDNNGEITIQAGVYKGIDNNGGTFTNTSGLITIEKGTDSPILNRNSATFTNLDLMDLNGSTAANKAGIDNRATFTNSGTLDIDDSQGQGILNFDASSSYTNSGTINIGVNAAISTNGIENNNGTFDNTGTITIKNTGSRGIYMSGSSTFNNNGGTINIDNTTLQALYNNGGTFSNTNVAEINIGLNAHCGHRGIDNNGTFTNEEFSGIYIQDVQYESIYTSGGTFSNFGTYKQVLPTGSYWAIKGVAGSSFINKSTGEIYSGKTIDNTSFTQEGILNPGNSPGILEIAHGFAPASTTVYNCEISGNGGANAGDQDQIRVTSGDVTLDGMLALDFGSFTPANNDEFIVLEYAGALSGTFSSVTGLPAGWVIDYGVKKPGWVVIYGPQSEIPIKLLSFKAKEVNGVVELKWETASEVNNDYFMIERGTDGQNFKSIGKIKGNGNSRDINTYSFKDHTASYGHNYYRLKQVDYDNRYEYSDVIDVQLYGDKLLVFPNPASDYINVFNIDNWENVTICDMKGEKIFVPKASGNKLNVSNLKKGVYFIKEKSKKALKFIIK